MTGALADADAKLEELKRACDRLVEDDEHCRKAGALPELASLAAAVRNMAGSGNALSVAERVGGIGGVEVATGLCVWHIAVTVLDATAWAAASSLVAWRDDVGASATIEKDRQERINAMTVIKFLVDFHQR